MLLLINSFASIQESSLGCMVGVVLCMKKLHFISQNWRRKNSTVACGSSHIKINCFDYPKRFINRINAVYFLSINIDITIFY